MGSVGQEFVRQARCVARLAAGLCDPVWRRLWVVAFEEASTVRHCSSIPHLDARMAVRGDNSVCLAHKDGPKHIDALLTTKFTAESVCTLGFDEGDSEKLLLLNSICRG